MNTGCRQQDIKAYASKPSGSYAKGIAKNTLLLFIRMLFLTIVNLYAVKIIIRGLGIEDYGIFTTIAGTVTMATVFNGVLSLSIQRFLSYAMGTGNRKELSKIFSISINIILLFSVITCLLLETLGLWIVSTQLNIPSERLNAAIMTYHFSVITLICSILQIPYTAAVLSHEHMGKYAVVSTLECIMRLIAAYAILYIPADHLGGYSSGLMLSAVITLSTYIIVARKNYPECHYVYVPENGLYKQILSFSGWTLFGSFANICMIQGNILLLNVSFGAAATASFGIAIQIYNAFNALSNSMVLAFRPPMIKAYAEHKLDQVNSLFYGGNKFIMYVLLAVALPLLMEMDVVIKIWLDISSEESIMFARLIIIYLVMMAMHNPVTIIMHATGKVKYYHLFVESATLMCVPISLGLFKLGLPAYYVCVSMISVCLIAHAIRLQCLRHYYKIFSLRTYLQRIVTPAIIIIIFSCLFIYFVHNSVNQPNQRLIIVFLSAPLIVLSLTYIIGTDKKEKMLLMGIYKSLLKKINIR